MAKSKQELHGGHKSRFHNPATFPLDAPGDERTEKKMAAKKTSKKGGAKKGGAKKGGAKKGGAKKTPRHNPAPKKSAAPAHNPAPKKSGVKKTPRHNPVGITGHLKRIGIGSLG